LPRHNLVHKHIVTTLKKLQSVLGPVNPSDLPIISINDPMTRWYGWAKNTIIFIDNPVMKSFRIVL